MNVQKVTLVAQHWNMKPKKCSLRPPPVCSRYHLQDTRSALPPVLPEARCWTRKVAKSGSKSSQMEPDPNFQKGQIRADFYLLKTLFLQIWDDTNDNFCQKFKWLQQIFRFSWQELEIKLNRARKSQKFEEILWKRARWSQAARFFFLEPVGSEKSQI